MPNGDAPEHRVFTTITGMLYYDNRQIVTSGILMNTKLCNHCANELPYNAKYCISCGTIVANTGKTERL